MLSRILGSETILLDSPLSPANCALRLQEAVRSRWDIFGAGAIIGQADADGFLIRNTGRRSFRLVLRGEFEKSSDGTLLRCPLRRTLAPFLALLPLPVVLLGMILFAVSGTGQGVERIPGVLLPVAFLIFIGFMSVLEFIRSEDDRDILLDFLRRVLEARVTGGQEPAAVQHRLPS
jgi:hypothetical protein